MQIDIPRGKGKGHWELILCDEFGDNPHWSAIVWCPECGRPLSCVNHTIAADGTISPSLGHPTEYPACAWHTNPRLIGWENRQAPPKQPSVTCARCGAQSRQLSGWGSGYGFAGDICPNCVAVLAQHWPLSPISRTRRNL